jgi:hypothetical protein
VGVPQHAPILWRRQLLGGAVSALAAEQIDQTRQVCWDPEEAEPALKTKT